MRPLLAGLGGLALALAGACDASKPELEKARKDLATVTAERDDLKGKLAQATSEVGTLKKENEELKAKAAGCSGHAQGRRQGAARPPPRRSFVSSAESLPGRAVPPAGDSGRRRAAGPGWRAPRAPG